MIFLRNLDARRVACVPIAPGWARLLYPGVTSQVPAQTVALPPVQRLLADGRLRVITEVSRAPSASEALRRDMAAAIAAAEARELAALVARQARQHGKTTPLKRTWTRRQAPGERKRRADEWPLDRVARLRARWAEGAPTATIAAELGVTPSAVGSKARGLGLPGCRTARGDHPAQERRQAIPAA